MILLLLKILLKILMIYHKVISVKIIKLYHNFNMNCKITIIIIIKLYINNYILLYMFIKI